MNILQRLFPLWCLTTPRHAVERQLHFAKLAYYKHAAQAEFHKTMRKMYEARVERLELDLHPESYECHITVSVADAAVATGVAASSGWKTSEIARDPVLGDATHFYLTCHATNYSFIVSKMKNAVLALEDRDVKVIREKIERIVYDTKGKKS